MEAVECELKYSGVGVAFLILAATATVSLVLATPMTALLRASLIAYAVALAARACRALLGPRHLRLDLERRIEVAGACGMQAGTLRDGSFVMPWLTIVRWRPDGALADRSLVLLPDVCSADNLRKIRVILRWA
jgi:toxin CptA